MLDDAQLLWLFVHSKHLKYHANRYLSDLDALASILKTEGFRPLDMRMFVL